MAKARAFISFDFDNDKRLKDFVIGQAKLEDSPFEVADWSLKEAAPEADWEEKAEARIKRCEVVIVIVGPKTHSAPGVLKEVNMARRNKIRLGQVIGYRDANPKPVPDAGRLYRWSWPNLETIING